MTQLGILLSAVFAVALTPVTSRAVSRPQARLRWLSIPGAALITALLAVSAERVLTLRTPFVVGLAGVAAVLATQVIIDLGVRRLPRELSYGGLVVFVVCALITEPMDAAGPSGLLVGLIAMSAIAALLVVVSRGALGLGDLHLSPLLGALVGWFAPGAVLLAWMITAVTGALVTTAGLATKRLSRGSMIPYGPFMVLGAVASVVVIAVRA